MTHTPATIAGINKRIAEFEGVASVPHKMVRGQIPNYWNSADAILPVVERLCRERGLNGYRVVFLDPEDYDDRILFEFQDIADSGETFAYGDSLPAAACLAVVAVLDGGGSERGRP